MTSAQVLLFKTEILNLSNLFQFCSLLSVSNLYGPCVPSITNGYLDATPAEFVNGLVNDHHEFRSLDWTSQLSYIDRVINTGKRVIFGTHNLTQLQLIKDHIPSNCFTISYSYGTELYERMLEHFVLVHLYRQDCGIIPISSHDSLLRNTGTDLVDYYKQSFDQQGLIPKQLNAVGDYSVPISDFFDYTTFARHFDNLNISLSNAAMQLYSIWQDSLHTDNLYTRHNGITPL